MSRYIDADKLKQDLDAWAINLHKPTNLVRDDTFVIIDEQPTADVVEVKHGHWVFCGVVDDIYGHGASCSVCGGYSEDNGYYCSCCGAKMDDALQRKTNPEAFKGGDDYE